jgi:hypothetical protein
VACSKRAIAVRWGIGKRVYATAALQLIDNNREREIAVREEETRLTALPEQATRVQIAAAGTAWVIGALPPAEDLETREPSAVADPLVALPVPAVREVRQVCAAAEEADGAAAGADEGEQAVKERNP